MECVICNSIFEQKNRAKTCSDDCHKIREKKRVVEAVTRRRKKIKLKAVEYKGGKCQVCNYNRCVDALDFHHLDESKKDFAIGSRGHSRSWVRVQAELDKCILVCSNCHREIHAKLITVSFTDILIGEETSC